MMEKFANRKKESLMSLFGKSKPDPSAVAAVPVFTVQTLPRNYECLATVSTRIVGFSTSSVSSYEDAMNSLGVQAAKLGADAVIGLLFHTQVSSAFVAFGTAIRYVD
jgi:uncharacterized protein YbjQ (UPF0145 family)